MDSKRSSDNSSGVSSVMQGISNLNIKDSANCQMKRAPDLPDKQPAKKAAKKKKTKKPKANSDNKSNSDDNGNNQTISSYMSSNSFYYELNLGEIERKAEEAKSMSSSSYLPTISDKAELKSDLKKNRRELKTPLSHPQLKPVMESQSSLKNPTDDPTELLKRLKLLQTGKITSVQNQRVNPLPQPKKAAKEEEVQDNRANPMPQTKKAAKEEEIARNKDEVQRINLQIQQKISRQIKPKLRQIIDRSEAPQINGFYTHPDKTTRPALHQKPCDQRLDTIARTRILFMQTRDVPIVKTVVESREIYRYSQDDLYQLQSLSTLELVPRLKDLKICATAIEDLDVFLLKYLSIKDEKLRLAMVLEAAENRQLIKRKGSIEFDFRSMPQDAEQPEKIADQDMTCDSKKWNEIEKLKSLARNDDELNDLVYRLEFNTLFADVIDDQEMSKQPLPVVIQHLIDTNKAQIIEGEIRVNSRNNHEAYVTQNGSTDVCVKALILRKHSFHGDFVKVLMKKSADSPTDADANEDVDLDATIQSETLVDVRNYGCVLEILEKRHSRRVVGYLAASSKKKKVLFTVRDPKVPNVQIRDISNYLLDLNSTKQRQNKLNGRELMVAEITSWQLDRPNGKIVKIIGEIGELKVENEAILLQHNLNPQPFAQSILDDLPADPFTIPAEEFAYREDLRKKCIFSIDPETARDLDDALSCETLPNGNLSIGVHISDVSYFLKENSELDEIVKERATSIYLVDKVYHMLPEPLCMLCSLLPGADKLAYSVFWEMKPDTAEIISTRFTRSVMNSCAKLSYEHAQTVIEKTDNKWEDLEAAFPDIHNGFTINEVANVIVQLQKLAVIMRGRRKDSGAIKIDQPKISFKFEKDDQRMEAPVDFFQYCQRDSNRLIEEFMLLANISVAKFIYEKFPKISLLRHHDPPNEGSLNKLVKTLAKNGIAFDVSSSSAISASMEQLTAKAKDWAGMNAALNLMVSKTMSRARYFCSDTAKNEKDFWHYALAMPIYTHFTSPIRRYPDILVHRALNAALEYEAEPTRSPEEVQKLAEVCNAQKYSAKLAGDDSVNMYFMQFLQSLKSKTMIAGVLGIHEYNLEVVLVETGHVLKVYYKNLQQSDEVAIKAFTENSPPYAIVAWPRLQQKSLKIKFGSEVLLMVEVHKEKLVANRIFCQK